MYKTLKRLWDNRATNGMTAVALANAVENGWITVEQKSSIMAE